MGQDMKHDNDNHQAANDNDPIRFLSVCSGIEAASVAWKSLGWKAVAFSEIEKFPSAVLAHHYPDTPNLGDMTEFQDWPDMDIDVLCGGTPCQPFSIAGLREGLNDPRGNLTLTFLGIVKKYEPRFIIWENVPGIFSEKTGALGSFLDGLEELGYVIDIDVLDAQFFGLAQRRRRVIVCAENIKHILKTKTISSSLTTAQCLQEISQLALIALSTPSTNALPDSELKKQNAVNLLKRRMKLFGMLPEGPVQMSLKSLGEHLEWLECEQGDLDSASGKNSAVGTSLVRRDTKQHTYSEGMEKNQDASASTDKSWQRILEGPLLTMSECITSTSSSETIESKIYSCAQMTLCIAKLMHQSMDSSPVYWTAAQSSLIALQEYIDYARQTSSDLFGEMEWIHTWVRFIEQAEPVIASIVNLTAEGFGQVLSISDCLPGNPAPRRKAGKGFAASTGKRPKSGSHWDGLDIHPSLNQSHNTGGIGASNQEVFSQRGAGLVHAPELARCDATREGSSQDYETTTMVAVSVTGETSHSLTAEGADASEDGTGRGTPVVAYANELADTITSNGDAHSGFRDKKGLVAQSVAIRGREGGATAELGGEVSGAIAFKAGQGAKAGGLGIGHVSPTLSAAESGSNRTPAIQLGSMVRRLTPRECERLMGFPDDYTAIPWRGKPAEQCPDGPRYKALGNSWAVPKFTWLGHAWIKNYVGKGTRHDRTNTNR